MTDLSSPAPHFTAMPPDALQAGGYLWNETIVARMFGIASLFDSAVKATRGAAKVARGEPLSQSTVRTSLGLFPFSNALPVVVMANSLMRNLPERDGR